MIPSAVDVIWIGEGIGNCSSGSSAVSRELTNCSSRLWCCAKRSWGLASLSDED